MDEPFQDTPAKKRRKLLRSRSSKYYSRKTKIEQALQSLPLDEEYEFENLPSSIFITNKAFGEIPYPNEEIISFPVNQSSWCVSTAKLETISLPSAVVNLSSEKLIQLIPSIFSMEKWNSLPQPAQEHLQRLLPNFKNMEGIDHTKEIENTLQKLFTKENFHFGNPIEVFFKKLGENYYRPDTRKMLQEINIVEQYSFIRKVKQQNQNTIQRILNLKRKMKMSESNNYLLYPPLHHQYSSFHKSYQDFIENSDTDADSAIEELPIQRKDETTQTGSNENISLLSPSVNTQNSLSPKSVTEEITGSVLGKRQRGSKVGTPSNRSLKILDAKLSGNVPESTPVWVFFHFLKDIFVENHLQLEVSVLHDAIAAEPKKASVLYPSYNLHDFIVLALHLLSNPPIVNASDAEKKKLKAARTKRQNENTSPITTDTPIEPVKDFQRGAPYVVEVEPSVWRWINSTDDSSIKEELHTLELLFYFAVSRNDIKDPENILHYVSVKQQKCTSTILPSTPEEIENYRVQEKTRYLSPEIPFRYKFRECESVVAPMKRGLGNQSQKPREHFLLRGDRPPHISLLCLVRDAAARLPGGIGTRPDVAILLCDSQFVVSDASEAKLNSVVSGALDRLHAQADPCVRFDSEQKLWIYLHRRRNENDFVVKKAKKKGKK